MQLLLIIAVVAVLAVADSAPQQPLADGLFYSALAFACMTAAPLFAVAISRLTVAGLDADRTERKRRLRRFGHLRAMHAIVWSVSTLAVVYFFGWTQLVRCNWQLAGTFLADELLILLPVVAPMMLSWAAFYEVDLAVAASMPSGERTPSTRMSYVMLHARQYLGLLLVPVLLLLALQDAVLSFAPRVDGQDYEVVVYLAALLVLLVFFPVLVRRVWHTTPLPMSSLRDRLVAVYRGHRAPVREILVWQTGDRILNAAVAGFFGRWRYLFLSDALLRHLADDEVAAVFAHEIGHIRHRHVWLRLLAGFAPIVLLVGVDVTFPTVGDWLDGRLAMAGLPTSVGLWLITLTGFAVYALTLFGRYCRLLEHQADLFACVHGGESTSDSTVTATMTEDAPLSGTQSFCVALERISALSGGPRDKATWLHPSTARRVEFVTRLAGDACRSHHFARRVRRINGLLLGVTAVAVLLVLFAR